MVERRHIPWWVAIPPEVKTEYVGVKLGQYYSDPRVMLETQLEARETLHKLYGLPKGGVGPTYSSYLTASTLGLELIFPEDSVPVPKGYPLKDIRQVDDLEVPEDLRSAGLVPRVLETYEYMRSQIGDEIPVGVGIGGQGPFTTGVLLRGMDFYADLYLAPERCHRLLELITENSIRLLKLADEIAGVKRRTAIGFTDDFSGHLSPEMYGEFSIPYLKRICDHFGVRQIHLHCETLKQAHLKFLPLLGVTHFDAGTGDLTVEEAKAELDISFVVQMKTSADMLLETPRGIERKYRQQVAAGAVEMGVELCREVPRENVRAFIRVAREYE